MFKTSAFFFLVVLLVLTLPGCQTPGGDDLASPAITSSPMVVQETDEVTAEVEQSDSESTSTPPAPMEVAASVVETIACGEIFCQVPWIGYLNRPIGDSDQNVIDLSYPYASTQDGTFDPHHGVEFANPYGTPVYASGPGEVVYAGTDDLTVLGPYTGFYGNVVILRHPHLYEGRDLFTLYAHLSFIEVEPGARVISGDRIGAVGASGAADGSHLHFEVRLDVNDYDHTTNPVLWFAPVSTLESERMGVIAGVILGHSGNPLPEFSFTLEKFGEDGSVEARYYPKTYYPHRTNGYPVLGETFVVPDVPAGEYRLVFISGRFYEIFFTLETGSLGFIRLQLD